MMMPPPRTDCAKDGLNEQRGGGNVNNMHFQELIPGEIRLLGASYFAFSNDAEERSRQLQHLQQLREDTVVQRARRTRLKGEFCAYSFLHWFCSVCSFAHICGTFHVEGFFGPYWAGLD